ncbi:EF-hand [Anaeromyces robustus]|uniref:EF-hand n=1 Tax=Anaeromyces robustus TaxID=1754192 RepID=A0A1Y1WUW9_9FUNG|nr:EF-hand [Anaeromyces robustus]|eukprot:ORX77252.1 EF-hand [Anaeromyces robustus]
MFCQNLPISKIMFNKYDKDHSGSITLEEFKSMSYDLGYYLSDAEYDIAVKTLDKTGSGSINYDDFAKWWKNSDRWNQIQLSEENMALLSALSGQFQMFDKDKNGSINSFEFKQFSQEIRKTMKVNAADDNEMFEQLDVNSDGKVSFNEFVDYVNSKCGGDLTKYFQ